jgi:FkbM family methyltransferase
MTMHIVSHLVLVALLLILASSSFSPHHGPPVQFQLVNVSLPDPSGKLEGVKADEMKFCRLCWMPNASFAVGELHHGWCLRHEAEQVALIGRVLTSKRDNCSFIDVGMNDGFYTQMAGSFGCKVYSFELQDQCIQISKTAVAANNIQHLVTIIPSPVSNVNDSEIHIKFPENGICDGGFTFSGHDDHQKRSHFHSPLVVDRVFRTVSLDAFVPRGAYIDLIKIDVEGHETEVLEGALTLLRERRVGTLMVELGAQQTYNNWTALMDVYHTIVSMNYSLTTLNCKSPKVRGPNEVFSLKNFDGFRDYATWRLSAPWEIWRCADLLIQSTL